jgi:hypothetical protein
MTRHTWIYLALGLAEAFLVSFMGLLVAGKVPMPAQVAWLVPAIAASLLFLTTQLPKLEAAELAAATTTTTTTTSVPVQPAPEPEAVSSRSPAPEPVVPPPVTPPVKKG